jgi:hypothetical protein
LGSSAVCREIKELTDMGNVMNFFLRFFACIA